MALCPYLLVGGLCLYYKLIVECIELQLKMYMYMYKCMCTCTRTCLVHVSDYLIVAGGHGGQTVHGICKACYIPCAS